MNERELLEAAVRFFADGGNSLQPTSPLIVAMREVLAAPATASAAPVAASATAILPARVGLTDAEKARRRATLGSSEIAAIVGVNPYATAHAVWASKVLGVDIEENEASRLGNLLEPTIFAIYADRYGRRLRKGDYVLGAEPWMSATPDAYIEGGGLVEAKLVGIHTVHQWGPGNTDEATSDAIPLHYMCQAQWQMAVTGEPFVDVSALMGSEFRSYTVQSDRELQAKLIAHGRAFWMNHVVTKVPPPVDGSKSCTDLLKMLYPRSGGESLPATERMESLVNDLRRARTEAEAGREARAAAENALKAELKDAGGAYGRGWRIRYATNKAGSRPFCFDDDQTTEGRAA